MIRAQQAAKDGLRDRVLVKGLPPSARPPFGYEFVQGDDGVDFTRLIPNRHWTVARYIWERALDGISMRGIIRELHEKGIPPPRGKALWAVQVIHAVLHNPTYGGRYRALRRRSVAPRKRRGDTYGNSSQVWKPMADWTYLPRVVVDQPVVTWSQYLDVQKRLQANKRFSPRNAKHQYLMRGMVFCETHQRNFQGRPREYKGGYVYVCPVVNNKIVPVQKCARQTMGGPTLDRQVWDQVLQLLSRPELILGELDRRRESKEETENSISDAIARANTRLQDNEKAEAELVTLRIRDDLRDVIYQRQMSL